jgi:hypothetical protein
LAIKSGNNYALYTGNIFTLNAQNNIEVSTDTELTNEVVYVLGHYPEGTDCDGPFNAYKKFFKITVSVTGNPCGSETIEASSSSET